MNKILLNTIQLDGDIVIKKGDGVKINNQSKSVEITENGTTEIVADAGYTGLGKVSVNVNVASSGSSVVSVPRNAVNFLDYDGTVLHSYTKEEFLALSEMPELPTREGLICQEWNWDFADAQSYVSEYGILDVGATYITDDGKTRLYITIAAKGRMDFPLYFYQSIANGVNINWGDGANETLIGVGNVNASHRYSHIGNYIITLDVADGCTASLGVPNQTGININGIISSLTIIYGNMIKKIEVGDRIGISAYAFNTLEGLEVVSIPNTIKSIFAEIFRTCYGLKCVIIPKSVNSINAKAFASCYSLKSISVPNSLTAISNEVFSSCYNLSSFVIPNKLSSANIQNGVLSRCYSLPSLAIPRSMDRIPNSMFSSCYGIAFFDFSTHTSVPTLASITAFENIRSDCKIIVSDTLYDEWITKTNWSTYASNIIKKSDWDASQA